MPWRRLIVAVVVGSLVTVALLFAGPWVLQWIEGGVISGWPNQPVPAIVYVLAVDVTALFVLIAPGIVIALWIALRGRPFPSETRCRKCGYILRGITEPRCPECGERI
jgi:hypothetical protein